MRIKEQHITFEDKIIGLVAIPQKKIYKKTKLLVRYSVSNVADSISFSDEKNFLVLFDVDKLKELLEKYEEKE